jgi:hypothetical protein
MKTRNIAVLCVLFVLFVSCTGNAKKDTADSGGDGIRGGVFQTEIAFRKR